MHFYLHLLTDRKTDLVKAFEMIMGEHGARFTRARSWYADPDTGDLVFFWDESPSDFKNTKPFPHEFDVAQVVAFTEAYLEKLDPKMWGDMPDIDGSCKRGFGIQAKDYIRFGPLEEQSVYKSKREAKFKSNYAFVLITPEWCEYHK